MENSDVLDSDFSGSIFTLDWREFFPLGGEHVLALRFVEGWGTDRPDPFRLGGENNADNTIFNARDYNLRGYPEGLPLLRGRRMQLASAEWRFPLHRTERTLTVPPLGISQLSGSVFVDSGGTWDQGNSPDKYLTGAGLELNADLALFYHLGLRLRLGYARGFNEGGEDRIYLSIGSSF